MERNRSGKLLQQFNRVRAATEQITEGLTEEDMVLQSMPDASPSKWHLAHTTWFFEEFVLAPYQPQFKAQNPEFGYLFNSYYEHVGKRHQRPLRGMLSRPSLKQVLSYRREINEKLTQLLDSPLSSQSKMLDLVELGLHHEMQHQELLLTDILHALSLHPFHPQVKAGFQQPSNPDVATLKFHQFDEAEIEIGTIDKVFHFDCEAPRHRIIQQAFALSNRPVSNGDWLEFINDRGYQTPTLWLSDGWARCQEENWNTPLYWNNKEGQWFQYGLNGLRAIDLNSPVCHISYYEADAFARWAGCRLPREQEWERAATQQQVAGNFLEQQQWRPRALATTSEKHPHQLFGDVWEWTQSSYSAYPGYQPAEGAVGEYNGNFMCGQFVLRGGSCVTPIQQIRPSYRNFFYPHQRWQFSGLRLAKDV